MDKMLLETKENSLLDIALSFPLVEKQITNRIYVPTGKVSPVYMSEYCT